MKGKHTIVILSEAKDLWLLELEDWGLKYDSA